MRYIYVYVDGACRGIKKKERTASVGVYFHSNILDYFSFGVFIGNKTNNEAEYIAVIEALKSLEQYGLEKYSIIIHSDSALVVGQLTRGWKINYEHLKVLNNEARKLMKKFNNVELVKVPRTDSRLEVAHNFAEMMFNEVNRLDNRVKENQ